MDRFGIYMERMRCKVSNNPRQFDWGTIIPTSVGFKDYNGNWHNLWVDVKVLKNTRCELIPNKGEQITVTGRMDYSEYNGKPQWTVTADSVETRQVENARPKFDGGGEFPF